MLRKILVIGGSGLVGSTFLRYGLGNYDLHATINVNKIEFNSILSTKMNLVEERSTIVDLINTFKPEVTIHTAAHPSVDLCESRKDLADTLHVDVTRDIAGVCKEIGSKLLYLSTDWVFGGELNKKYTESDTPNPINYYGKTRLLAEKIIMDYSPSNVVLRTAVIYGWHKRSRFTNWILQSLMEKKIVDPHVDQYATPTLVDDLVKSMIRIIDRDISGLYHAAGKTCINRYEFARLLARIFGLDENLIKPVTAIEKKQDAPRPVSSCLDSTRLEKIIDYEFSDVSSGVNYILKRSKDDSIK